MRDAFGIERQEVAKDLAGAKSWANAKGQKVSLKAKEAPIKAILKGEELLHATAPKTATRAQRAKAGVRRASGLLMREIGYRPDAAAMALTRLPSLVTKGVPGGAKAWVAAGKPHWTQQHGATYTVRRVQAAMEGKAAAKALAQRRLSDSARAMSRGRKEKKDAVTGNPFRQGRMTTAALARSGDAKAQRRLGSNVPGLSVLP